MIRILRTEPADTKYRAVHRKTPRRKVILYDIDEIWSIDLAYVDKLGDYNKNIKYLMVAVGCMSRFLRVQPLKSKYATSTAEALKQMIKTKQPKKVWVDKDTEFKGSFILTTQLTREQTALPKSPRMKLRKRTFHVSFH